MLDKIWFPWFIILLCEFVFGNCKSVACLRHLFIIYVAFVAITGKATEFVLIDK